MYDLVVQGSMVRKQYCMYVLQKCASTTIAQDVLSCELFRRAIAALLSSATIKASLRRWPADGGDICEEGGAEPSLLDAGKKVLEGFWEDSAISADSHAMVVLRRTDRLGDVLISLSFRKLANIRALRLRRDWEAVTESGCGNCSWSLLIHRVIFRRRTERAFAKRNSEGKSSTSPGSVPSSRELCSAETARGPTR